MGKKGKGSSFFRLAMTGFMNICFNTRKRRGTAPLGLQVKADTLGETLPSYRSACGKTHEKSKALGTEITADVDINISVSGFEHFCLCCSCSSLCIMCYISYFQKYINTFCS